MNKNDLLMACPYKDIERLSGEDLGVFCCLYGLAYNRNIFNHVLHIHVNSLYQYLGLPSPVIREALDKLSIYGVVRINKDNYDLHQKYFFEKKQAFVLLSCDDVQKIINSGYSYRYDLLYLYFSIIRYMDGDICVRDTRYFVNIKPIGYFATILGVGNITTRKYIETLEELGILYVYRVAEVKKPNLMGLAKNRDLIYEYAQSHKIYERTASFGSIMLKYKALCNGKQYSPEEIVAIRKGVERYNTFHPGKEKDMSVFS